MTDAELDAMFEASKLDTHTLVGSEVRVLIGDIRRARASERDLRDRCGALAEECERKADESLALYEREVRFAQDPKSEAARMATEYRWHETAHRKHAAALRALALPATPARMTITKPGRYVLTADLGVRNLTTVATLPAGTEIEITQIDLAHHKVIGPQLLDWMFWDLPATPATTTTSEETSNDH